MAGIVLRKAIEADCEMLMEMFLEIANYYKFPELMTISKSTLIKDGFKEDPPLYHAVIIEMNGLVAGYLVYFYAYDPYVGPHLYSEDIYIKPDFRAKGLGTRVMAYLARVAERDGLPSNSWSVTSWNDRTLKLYRLLGAFDQTEVDGTHMYRLDQLEMAQLSLKNSDNGKAKL